MDVTMNASSIEFKHNHLSQKISELLTGVQVVTKQLKLQAVRKGSDKKKLVISTNFLNFFNFTEGSSVLETVVGKCKGMVVRSVPSGTDNSKLVYGRNYKNRDREALMDIRHQSKLDEALGSAEQVHITFKKNELIIVPIYALQSKRTNEAVNIKLDRESGVFTGVVEAVKVIKDKAFAMVTVDAESEFSSSHESVLLGMQLRRMGYEISTEQGAGFVATLPGPDPESIIDLDLTHSSVIAMVKGRVADAEFDYTDRYSTFAACTGGVDISSIEDDGFNVSTALDYRPSEERDYQKATDEDGNRYVVGLKSDKTESGILCAGVNGQNISTLINEDIYQIDMVRLKPLIAQHNHFSISLQCCDFSTLKHFRARTDAIEKLSSTRDMIFPALDIIESTRVPTFQLENVPGFASSIEYKLFESRVIALGYKVHMKILNASDFNGYTSRKRCYMFCSLLDADFEFPTPEVRTAHMWNEVIAPNIDGFRAVADNGCFQTMREGKALKAEIAVSGREPTKAESTKIRKFDCRNVAEEGDHIGGTLLKSQNRQVAETFYALIDGQYYMPRNDAMKMLMGIKPEFDVSFLSQELGAEIIGQAVDCRMHSKLSQSVKAHLDTFALKVKGKVLQVNDRVLAPVVNFVSSNKIRPEDQMAFSF